VTFGEVTFGSEKLSIQPDEQILDIDILIDNTIGCAHEVSRFMHGREVVALHEEGYYYFAP